MDNTPPDLMKYWRHRRVHAYTALFYIILQTPCWVLLSIHYPDAYTVLGTLQSFSYTMPTGILSAYYLGSSLQDFIDKR